MSFSARGGGARGGGGRFGGRDGGKIKKLDTKCILSVVLSKAAF